MAVLNAWQRPDRVLKGMMWGDFKEGIGTISTSPNVFATVTGSAGSVNAVAGSTSFANGDLVALYQTIGSGAGQWEFNLITAGGGTNNLTFKVANHYAYASGAQIIKVLRYKTATISAHSISGWNGSVGGVEFILAGKNAVISGAINAAALGFYGGAESNNNSTPGQQGYSYAGSPGNSRNPNYSGGGGGSESPGGGAGHAGAGSQGSGGNAGLGGGASDDSTDGTKMYLGSGGGGACHGDPAYASGGGSGGGLVVVIAKNITNSSSISTNGSPSGASNDRRGGSGSGGYVLLVCETASLGSNTITSDGATSNNGGASSVGRIAVQHKGTVTGTTYPTFTDVVDPTLKQKPKGGAFLLEFL